MDLLSIVSLLVIVIAGALLLSACGKCLVERVELNRLLLWLVALLPFMLTHFVLLELPSLARVVGLCSVLLLGMKVVVYAEWRRSSGSRLSWAKWICFTWLWFGMDPAAFAVTRRSLSWTKHIAIGVSCITLGAIGLSLTLFYKLDYFQAEFICMSMMFHFGVLRLLTGFWRFVGYPVRTLFRNPLASKGFNDFWSRRWNLAYSQMMVRAVQRPLRSKLGDKGSIFAVFIVSGLFHEFAITVPVQAGYGLPTLFFLVQGMFSIMERKIFFWNRYVCLLSLLIGLPILFPHGFVDEVIEPLSRTWSLWIK